MSVFLCVRVRESTFLAFCASFVCPYCDAFTISQVAGQTEEQRTSKLRTATVKSSWRDKSLPVNCLLPKAATYANAAAASALVKEAFRDAVVSNAWRLAFFLIGGGAAGLGVRALTGRASPRSSSSSPTILMAENLASEGGEAASTSVGATGLAPLWVLLVVVGVLVALAASLAARRLQRYLRNAKSDKAFFGATSARAHVCAYLGSKVHLFGIKIVGSMLFAWRKRNVLSGRVEFIFACGNFFQLNLGLRLRVMFLCLTLL